MNKLAICLTAIIWTFLAVVCSVNADTSIDSLLRQGSQYQRSGYYLDAQTAYQNALEQAEQQADMASKAIAKSALGTIAYLLHHPESAEALLAEALNLAKAQNNRELISLTQYYRGLTAFSRQQRSTAASYLQAALSGAQQSANKELSARCHLALAQIAQTLDDFKQHQQQALDLIEQFKATPIAGELRLQLAELWLEPPLLKPQDFENGADPERLATVFAQLQLAASELDPENRRGIAQYHGLLGKVYETQQRYAEALDLTQTALQDLQGMHADDLKIIYNWQAARVYTALKQAGSALDSYRRAITIIQGMRQDIPVTYQDGQSSFLQLFGPLYRSASALLLQQAHTDNLEQQKSLLTEARGLMERLKQTELEDFFNDRCLLNGLQSSALHNNSSKTAVFYPIILPDRIELLLSIGDQLIQRTVEIPSATLEAQIRYFSNNLRIGLNVQEASEQLYNWLIKPLEAELNAQTIDTLVYIPDGVLRLLPLAALSDGEHYVLERFVITTLPSLALIPGHAKSKSNNTLLAGLSEPSQEIGKQLPEKLLQLFNDAPKPTSGRNLPAMTQASRALSFNRRALDTPKTDKLSDRNLQVIAESLALPGVKTEIEQLAGQLPSQVILNHDYTLHNFDMAVRQPDYNVVHIASHGYFGGSSDDSFIMTYDKLLFIDNLESMLKARNQGEPIDLIVLSACQTAEGDDRAPLGLAGVALKAKANNALGTLWPIADQAAVKVMPQFYTGFNQKGLSKAKALQQAQLSLLQDPNFSNPYFWAPFILVGNGE